MAKNDSTKKRALLNMLNELTEVIESNDFGHMKAKLVTDAEAHHIAGVDFSHEELSVITAFLISLEEHFTK